MLDKNGKKKWRKRLSKQVSMRESISIVDTSLDIVLDLVLPQFLMYITIKRNSLVLSTNKLKTGYNIWEFTFHLNKHQ